MDGRWPGCLVHGFYVPEGGGAPSALAEAMASAQKSFQDEPTKQKVVEHSSEIAIYHSTIHIVGIHRVTNGGPEDGER